MNQPQTDEYQMTKKHVANFKKGKVYQCACQMPSGRRHQSGATYDVRSSEIVRWLVSQPVILQNLFDKVSKTGAIVFDPQSRTWSGRDNSTKGNHDPELDDKLDHDLLRERVSAECATQPPITA
jgi:hypothetical protein